MQLPDRFANLKTFDINVSDSNIVISEIKSDKSNLVEPFNSIKVTLKTVMRKEVDKTYQLLRICC